MAATEYKQSKIGEIPADWNIQKVSDIFKVETGTTPSTKKENYWKNGEIEWVTPADMSKIKAKPLLPESNRKVTKKAVKDTNLTLMPKGSIIISTRAPVGYVALVNKEATFNQGCKGLVPKKEVDTTFYCYYLLYQSRKLDLMGGQTTFKELTKTLLENFDIVEPPLPEQQKIAEVFSTVDNNIQKVDEIIANTERLKKGLMQELLTKGIGHEEFKDTKIGRIPKEWDVVKLTDVADYINGYGFSPKEWGDMGLPIVRIQNLTDPKAEFNYFEGDIDSKYIINNGDIIFPWSASIGIYKWNRGKAVLNQHLFKVIPKKNIDKEYLYHTLYLAIKQLKNRMHGSTMKHFKRNELERTFIPLPPLPEQKKIAKILSIVDKKLELEKNRKQKLKRIKKGLMNDLLTGRKRIKLSNKVS